MKYKRFFILLALVATVCNAFGQNRKGRELNPYEMGKLPGKVYLFGFSQTFGDTIAYMTEVNTIDSIMLQKKTKFLPFRQEFSLQLKEHLEGKKGLLLQTPCVFYSSSKSKATKRLNKMKKRYMKMDNTSIVNIPSNEFSFVHPLDKVGVIK